MKRTAQAHWQGDLRSGTGNLTTATHTLNSTAYSFHARFEDGAGTNPEELLAAAHAGCFTMALSGQLGAAGLVAESLDTECTITLEKGEGVRDYLEPPRTEGEDSGRQQGSFRYGR